MHPFAPLFLSFASGVYVASKLHFSSGALYLPLILSSAPAVLLYTLRSRFNPLIVTPVFFFIGALFITHYTSPLVPANHIKRFIEKPPLKGEAALSGAARIFDITAVVSQTPPSTGGYAKFRVEAKKIFYRGGWRDTRGGIRLKVRGGPVALERGDYVRFLGSMRETGNFGNPGEFDYKSWLRMRGVEVTGFVKNPALIVKLRDAPPGIARRVESVRDGIGGFIENSGVKNPGILKALITGDRTGIDSATKEAYISSGAVHLLAISGLHMGIVVYFSYTVILFILKRSARLMLAVNVKKAALIFSLLPVLGYAGLTGFSLPTVRAALMAGAFVIAFLVDRGRSYYNTLAMAALVILVIEPYALWEASFQLTFTAVFFILYLYPWFYAFFKRDGEGDVPAPVPDERLKGFILRRLRGRPLQSILVTLAASIGTYPLVAYHFQRASTVGLATNLIAVPLTGVTIPFLFVSALLIKVSAALSAFFLHGADIFLSVQVAAVRFFSALPFASLWVSRPTVIEVFLIYGFIITLPLVTRGRVYKFLSLLLLFFFILDLGYWRAEKSWNKELRVTFLSVGQGDSSLIEFPGGATMLIDGGGLYSTTFDTGADIIAPVLRYKKIKRIDYMVLSHAQRDHMKGLKFVARNFKVGEFWWNGYGSMGGLGGILEGKGVPVKIMGEKKLTLMIKGVKVEVMPTGGRSGLDINNRSLVVRLSYGEESFLFPGDIGRAGEAELIRTPIKAHVLKSPHHGSRTSSSEGLLRALRPSLVVVSAGRYNPFGFPHAETLRKYEAAGSRVLRTDHAGAVEIKTPGRGLEVRTFGGDGP